MKNREKQRDFLECADTKWWEPTLYLCNLAVSCAVARPILPTQMQFSQPFNTYATRDEFTVTMVCSPSEFLGGANVNISERVQRVDEALAIGNWVGQIRRFSAGNAIKSALCETKRGLYAMTVRR